MLQCMGRASGQLRRERVVTPSRRTLLDKLTYVNRSGSALHAGGSVGSDVSYMRGLFDSLHAVGSTPGFQSGGKVSVSQLVTHTHHRHTELTAVFKNSSESLNECARQ